MVPLCEQRGKGVRSKLQRVCKRMPTTARANDSYSLAGISMATSWSRFIRNGRSALLTDYFSRFPEVVKLVSTTSSSVITILKAIFSRHGLPEVVRSDNGPQFASTEFTKFAQS